MHTRLKKFFKSDVCHEIPCSNRDSVARLTLRELEALPCLRTTRLLALNNPRISGQQSVRPQGATHLFVRCQNSASNAKLNRSRLPTESTAANPDHYGEVVLQSCYDKRASNGFLVSESREEIIQRSAVDCPVPSSRTKIHTSYRCFAAPYGLRSNLIRQTSSDASLCVTTLFVAVPVARADVPILRKPAACCTSAGQARSSAAYP